MNFLLNNLSWIIPTGFIVADVVVKATPWHGDDDLLDAVWDAYRKITGRTVK